MHEGAALRAGPRAYMRFQLFTPTAPGDELSVCAREPLREALRRLEQSNPALWNISIKVNRPGDHYCLKNPMLLQDLAPS